MRYILFIIIILILIGCGEGEDYVLKIEGTKCLNVKIEENIGILNVKNFTTEKEIPYRETITSWESNLYRVKVTKLDENGKMVVKIIKYSYWSVFTSAEEILEWCSTEEPYGTCELEIGL